MAPSSERPVIETWYKIAKHLGRGIRTVQGWEQNEGLPIYREPNRVWAYVDELDDFKKKRIIPPRTPQESEPGPESAAHARRNLNYKLLLAIAAILASILLIAFRLRPTEIRQPSRIRVIADTLFVFDQQGQEMFRHTFAEELGTYPESETELSDRYATVDLDGDGHKELLFIQYPPSNRRIQLPSKLVCFRGQEIIGSVTAGEPLIYGPDHKRDQYVPPYHINQVLVIPGKPYPKIAISSVHNIHAPCQVLILDHNLKRLADYWHPGHLNLMSLHQLDENGHSELILAGVNNQHRSGTVIGLDPDTMQGTPKTVIDPRVPNSSDFALLEHGIDDEHLAPMSAGTEKFVVLFPRSRAMFKNGKALAPYNRVHSLSVGPKGFSVLVSESTDMDSGLDIFYELDWQLNVTDAIGVPKYRENMRQLFEAKQIDHEYSDADRERFKKNVVVRKYR